MFHQGKHVDITLIHVILLLMRPEHFNGHFHFTEWSSPHFSIPSSEKSSQMWKNKLQSFCYHVDNFMLSFFSYATYGKEQRINANIWSQCSEQQNESKQFASLVTMKFFFCHDETFRVSVDCITFCSIRFFILCARILPSKKKKRGPELLTKEKRKAREVPGRQWPEGETTWERGLLM